MTTDSMTKDLSVFSDAEIRDEYAERFTIAEQLATFSNDDIESEYEDRFGLPRELTDYDSDELIDEITRRGDFPEPETVVTGEVIDLLAEAARTSQHAARAYALLDLPSLEARQRLIAGRMSEVAA